MENPVKLASKSDAVCFQQKRYKCDGVLVSETLVKGSARPASYSLFPDRGFEAVLALHRHKPPWTRPATVDQLSSLPRETLWAVLKPSPSAGFLVLSAVADPSSGCCTALQGSDSGLDNFEIAISGADNGKEALFLHALEVPAGTSLALAAAWSVCLLQRQLVGRGRAFELRASKSMPTAMRRWGWCSWDAYGVQVRPENLLQVAKRFQPPWMVLDDGWQEQVSSEKWREWLHTQQSAFLAHAQFGDLKVLVKQLQPSELFVWHTLQGYWGGVRPNRGYITQVSRPVWPEALRRACPSEVDVWDGNFNLVKGKSDIARYYSDFYAALAFAGIKGVKCDGQFLPELLLMSEDSVAYASAQERAALEAFGKDLPVLHCMALTLWRIHGSARASVTRVSDDHAYPGVEEDAAAVARHIWHCGTNSLWLREIFFCDWDMLRTSEWHANIHSVARAVSGGPLYVSDLADQLKFDVIKPLLLPDESACIVPCNGCGVPIERHAFVDPTSSSEAWWIANTTEGGWIAVAFGLRDAGSDLLHSTLFPGDLGSGAACVLQVDLQTLGHAAEFSDSGWDVDVYYMNYVVLAVAPLLHVRHAGRRIAVFGLHGVWNPTGTLERRPRLLEDCVEVKLLCTGKLLVWVDGPCTLGIQGSHCISAKSAGLVTLPVSSKALLLEVDDL